jgi:hypothetical protein
LGERTNPAKPGFTYKVIQIPYNPSITNLNMSGTNPNTNNLRINAKFNQIVNWELKIYSPKTGAERIFEGISDTINENMVRWRSGSSNYYFFERLDTCFLELRVLGIDTPIFKSKLRLTNVLEVNSLNSEYLINGTLYAFRMVANFEKGESIFGTPYVDLLDGDVLRYRFDDPTKRIKGNSSLYMYSNDANNPNTYCAGFDTKSLRQFNKIIKKDNPDSVFFNAFIYGTGKKSTSILFLVYELDQPEDIPDFNPELNDKYQYRIQVDWEGWKKVSFPYSALKKAQNGGGKGNNILNPKSFCGLSISLDSYPLAGQEVEFYMDYLVITESQPLDLTVLDKF